MIGKARQGPVSHVDLWQLLAEAKSQGSAIQ